MKPAGKRENANKVDIGAKTVIYSNEIKRVHLVYRYLKKL